MRQPRAARKHQLCQFSREWETYRSSFQRTNQQRPPLELLQTNSTRQGHGHQAVSLAVTTGFCPPPPAACASWVGSTAGAPGCAVLFILQLSSMGDWALETHLSGRGRKGIKEKWVQSWRESKLKDYTSGNYFSLVTRIFLPTEDSGSRLVRGWFGCSSRSSRTLHVPTFLLHTQSM